MNPLLIAVVATVVALGASGISGWACWRWHHVRRSNQELRLANAGLRCRLDTYRTCCAELTHLAQLALPAPTDQEQP